MKVVIPVTTHDVTRLPKMVKALIHFGGLIDHGIVFLHSPSCAAEAKQAADEIRPSVGGVECFETSYEYQFGLFTDVNMLFVSAVRHLANIGNKEPFLWLELDARPIDYGWLNTLVKEYKQKGRECMGNVVDLPLISAGELITVTNDKMMMAVGIYPANLSTHPESSALVADLSKPPPRNPEPPFDVYLRGSLRRIGMADTNLIADQWNTINFRKTTDGIACDAKPINRTVRLRGGLVNKEAVLIHGCKDDSLDNLLFPERECQPDVTATPHAAPTPGIVGGSHAPLPAGDVASGEPSGLKELVEAKLAKGSLRLHVLASELKSDNQTMKAKLEAAGFKVSVPAGWIKAA
jgi:hypothetical protein